ncbi:sensor histidine kinase [Desulforamulus hydrothermalis]|uniref:histidine kinase n=1 Tax=Desulforamulus hydrothermalis Lam5 = DSM 18033 TaxID=1121428 RepID=K8E113_9FIRM|nr:HAMP domain-containing sensor histidine kinase [Desulforamulus hydrothermalis]CCO09367.1 Integral membrane sensor signal transduction histidine kinase [Desulforamulus hydrothermalis Lam5 = DSM 18033]SHH32023.1 HAMP domain-containing protein [Desulforamulus hydrothermalis Lam5 = DSM 18033]
MKPGGIVKKLWLATTLLVILTMGLTTLSQLWLLEKTYYRQQSDRLLTEARAAAADLAEENNSQTVFQQLQGLANSLQATVFLTDREGTIVLTARSGWGHGMMHGMGLGMGMGMGHQWLSGNVSQSQTKVDMSQILAGAEIIYRGHHPMFNTEILTAAVPVKKAASVVGALVVNTPLQPIDNNLRALQGTSLYSLLGGLLLAALVSWLLSRYLSGPLLQMQEVAKSMAQGDYSRRVDVTRNDEIGWLAESLNSLACQLAEKISLLRRIDQTRRDFVAGVSHELRTPLTIIQGNAEALLDGVVKDPAKQRQYLNNILEETLRLRRLTSELLDMRKIELGEVILNKQAVDAVSLFNSVVNKMQDLAAARGIVLRFVPPSRPILITADSDRLGQILINLTENALRFSPPGGEVLVTLAEHRQALIAEVKDNGPGIPEEEQPFIWDKFYKVDKSRCRSAGGTGLGLAIVKQLVELHGGTVSLSSKPGRGTTFRFTIPKQ